MIGIVLGFFLDYVIGDPYNMPHPIRWIGNLISFLEKTVRKAAKSEKDLFLGGLIITISVVLITGIISFGLLYLSSKISIYLAIAVNGIMCYYALAMRCLKKESMKVYYALENNDIEGSRYAVSMIVGRDTKSLDDIDITKAAVETVAENTSDGVLAPLFYMLIGLGPFAMVYKAINTMDSMLGYKDEKYKNIGCVCAKLDDVVNYIPSRLSALFMILSSVFLGFNYKNAFKIWKRDRYNHASPNSAQTEAVVAGALDVQLSGDAYYFGKLYKKKFIGDNLRKIEHKDIKSANNIMFLSAVLFLVVGLILRGMVLWQWF